MGKRIEIWWFAGGIFFGIIIGVLGMVMRNRILPTPIIINPPAPTPLPTPTDPPPPIRVYVNGAVENADVYLLPAGSVVNDAIEAAGGFSAVADGRLVNLAQPLADGMQIFIPAVDEEEVLQPMVVNVTSPTPTAEDELPAGDPENGQLVNINLADQRELESLPGIGPALAGRIIAYRQEYGPFESIEDIQSVSGIGPAIFEDIKDLITVE